MKKALSALLVAAVILGFAAPLAFADAPTGTLAGSLVADRTTIYVEPDPDDASQKNFATVNAPDHTCAPAHTGDCLFYWDTVETFGMSPLTFRPERCWLDSSTPADNNNTTGNEKMRLETYVGSRIAFPENAAGDKLPLVVEYYAECQCCGNYWTIEITIIPPEKEEPRVFGIFEILASWWFDLKWTWDYQIHPFFKYIYFNAWSWTTSAWTLLINAICGLFDALIGAISGAISG